MTSGTGLCALVVPLASFAQPQRKPRRIGFLGAIPASANARRFEALRTGLRDLGYEEGRNIVIEYRSAAGEYERLPELAADLVRSNVEVIVTHGTPGTRAAQKATQTIPIVMAIVGDAVAAGLVASLARPGGNVTGSMFLSPELAAKQVELLKEAMPRLTRVGLLGNSNNPAFLLDRQAAEVAATSLKVGVQLFDARASGEFESAFSEMGRKRVEAVWVAQEANLMANSRRIAELAATHRLLSAGNPVFAGAGGLIGYGVDATALFRRAAHFVDKILKGARPGDLPVERAAKFELVINMKTARALGVTIPQSVLVRATKVIE